MTKRSLAIAVLILTGAIAAFAQPRTAAVGKDVTVLGFKLHYLEAGRGTPVVLLHGLGGDGSRWAPNIDPLARDFHVFALECHFASHLEWQAEFIHPNFHESAQ